MGHEVDTISELVSTESLVSMYIGNYLPKEVFSPEELRLAEHAQEKLETLWEKYESGESYGVPEMETAICQSLNEYVNETFGATNLPDSRAVLGDGNLLPAGSDWITQEMFIFQLVKIEENIRRISQRNSTGTQKLIDETDLMRLARHRDNITEGYNSRLDGYRRLFLENNYISHATPEFVRVLQTGVLATRSAQEGMDGKSAFNSSGTGNLAKPEHIEKGQQSFALGSIVFRYAGQIDSTFVDPARRRYSGVVILPTSLALRGDIYMHSGDGLILSGKDAQAISLGNARLLMRGKDYTLAHEPVLRIRKPPNFEGGLEAIKNGTYEKREASVIEEPNVLSAEELKILDDLILRDANGAPVLVPDDYFTMREHQRRGDEFDKAAREAMQIFEPSDIEKAKLGKGLFKPSLLFADSPTGSKVYVKKMYVPEDTSASVE